MDIKIAKQPPKLGITIPPGLQSMLADLRRVHSTYATMPLTEDGFLNPVEWANAGGFDFDGGKVMVKNDLHSLWVAIDVMSDTVADLPDGDYFWLAVDIDRNEKVTPYRDITFSPTPGHPDKLCYDRYITDSSWTGISPCANSAVRPGFGPTQNESKPHRVWELRLDLGEIGALPFPAPHPTIVRIGLHVVSRTPSFTTDSPKRLSNFKKFHEIVLAPPVPDYGVDAGVVIGGIGLVPAGKIDANGLSTWWPLPLTTNAASMSIVDHSAFGGTLNFLANTATLQAMSATGVTKFSLDHQFGGASRGKLQTTWTNYRFDGTDYIAEAFGPDANGLYPVPDLTTDYLIKALLFQWPTAGEPNGLHTLELKAYDGAGNVRYKQAISFCIDNHAPDAELLEILHDGAPIAECAFVKMKSPSDAIDVKFRAYDGEGLLARYLVDARFGKGGWTRIAERWFEYDPANPTATWNGVDGALESFTPPRTCSYEIRVTAWGRVTDGYRGTQFDQSSSFITLQV